MIPNHIVRWMWDERFEFWFPRKRQPEVFVRFGKWSRGSKSMNFHTGEYEKGLSVYRGRLNADKTVSLIADDWSMRDGLTAEACAGALVGRLAFVVTGKVVGQGSDGEPLLVGVRLLPYAIAADSIPIAVRKDEMQYAKI